MNCNEDIAVELNCFIKSRPQIVRFRLLHKSCMPSPRRVYKPLAMERLLEDVKDREDAELVVRVEWVVVMGLVQGMCSEGYCWAAILCENCYISITCKELLPQMLD